eukprot:INCI13953.2.p1 GENE.INCI13953.2~~INCI13953.2.p1  ORF type:complete len:139 (+),score=21.16 INCI13953.2:169-585(+)
MSAGDISKSARFLSVAGFLVTTLLIPFNLMRIISASLPDGSAQDYALAEGSVMTFVVLSVAAILIKLVGIFSGYTVLYSDTINFLQFVLNVSGSVRLSWFIIFEGAYNWCWVLFATHLVPSLLIEAYVWLAILVFKTK